MDRTALDIVCKLDRQITANDSSLQEINNLIHLALHCAILHSDNSVKATCHAICSLLNKSYLTKKNEYWANICAYYAAALGKKRLLKKLYKNPIFKDCFQNTNNFYFAVLSGAAATGQVQLIDDFTKKFWCDYTDSFEEQLMFYQKILNNICETADCNSARHLIINYSTLLKQKNKMALLKHFDTNFKLTELLVQLRFIQKYKIRHNFFKALHTLQQNYLELNHIDLKKCLRYSKRIYNTVAICPASPDCQYLYDIITCNKKGDARKQLLDLAYLFHFQDYQVNYMMLMVMSLPQPITNQIAAYSLPHNAPDIRLFLNLANNLRHNTNLVFYQEIVQHQTTTQTINNNPTPLLSLSSISHAIIARIRR